MFSKLLHNQKSFQFYRNLCIILILILKISCKTDEVDPLNSDSLNSPSPDDDSEPSDKSELDDKPDPQSDKPGPPGDKPDPPGDKPSPPDEQNSDNSNESSPPSDYVPNSISNSITETEFSTKLLNDEKFGLYYNGYEKVYENRITMAGNSFKEYQIYQKQTNCKIFFFINF